ncbi:hypothetical protein Cch01nite_41700 [Cellulomonas chitinilytica]|uniref:Uncharacterized protein n=1 Tax=Cellulomonas chitinilytica TaxID=398759 RepID=A0A919P8C8_9CELL|nr:hypothetical protein Cch01nite_41700 [Cellulomonas chitinilytica]
MTNLQVTGLRTGLPPTVTGDRESRRRTGLDARPGAVRRGRRIADERQGSVRRTGTQPAHRDAESADHRRPSNLIRLVPA